MTEMFGAIDFLLVTDVFVWQNSNTQTVLHKLLCFQVPEGIQSFSRPLWF